jgi:hypothetical protein
MARKATTTKKTTTPAATFQKLFRGAIVECAAAVGRGIERVACPQDSAAGERRAIKLSRQAACFWGERYWPTVTKGLKTGNWVKDHTIVLEMCELLGVRSAERAVAEAPKANPVTITAAHVRAASKEIEANGRCQAGSGRGRYCYIEGGLGGD